MPIKRRTPKARDHRVTPAALAAFAAGDSLALHRALGLKPWQPSPLETDEDDCPWPDGSAWAVAWPLVRGLRVELEALNPSPQLGVNSKDCCTSQKFPRRD